MATFLRILLMSTGSFQLSLCGLHVVTHRTIIEILPTSAAPHVGLALQGALAASQRLADLMLTFSAADRDLFWMPCEVPYG